MRKGAWLNSVKIVRQARQTNENDVRIQKIKSLEFLADMFTNADSVHRIAERIQKI